VNTSSNNTPESSVTTGVSSPGYNSSSTQPFYWSVRRELWENRSIYVAPLIVAVVALFGFLVSTIGMPERRQGALLLDPANQRAVIGAPYDVAAMMLIFTAFIVGVFYCLDALHSERRDRSILFWKSLPVSDLTTVLSKATIPLVVLPVIIFAIIVFRAVSHVVMEQRSSAAERPCRDDVDAFQFVSTIADTALQPDCDCALARAYLRLGIANLRMGAARDVSLGGVTVPRNWRS
jgi:hypothetical protein